MIAANRFFEIINISKILLVFALFPLSAFTGTEINEPSRLSVPSERDKNPCQSLSNDTRAKYAVIITIDGLRPDAIVKSNAANLKSFIKQGAYTLDAQTVIPSDTIPAHTSLATGLDPERHKKRLNFWKPFMGYLDKDTIFTIAKKQGLKTAMFVGKDKLEYLAKPGSIDRFESTERVQDRIEKIASHFSSYVKTEKPELTLIHFPEPDLTGHKKGWMSGEYIKAFERVDRAIGFVIESLREAGIYDDTFIIITSDHGGEGKKHKGSVPKVITIPWIAFGNGVKKDYKIKERVYIHDTAPTVLSALGIKHLSEWDGKTIKEIFINKFKNSTSN